MAEIMVKDDKNCFACGSNNKHGLHMQVQRSDGKAETEMTLKKEHQGWQNIAHGGIVSTILDEIMAHAIATKVPGFVTAEIKVRYKKPVPIGEPITAFGRVENINSRIANAYSEIRTKDTDELLAIGDSKFIIIDKIDI
jgi:uncharacterized protein (TIGR00369 family)